MDDLVAFVEARLADDERLAGRAAALCGCCPPSVDWRLGDDESGGRIELDNPHNLKLKLTRRWNGSYGDLFTGEHIVRHDPARVLREVQAKRRLLQQFVLRGNSVRATVQPATGGVWDDLLRMLAAPYADHPDFRSEWRDLDG